ncbi:hypothetical protein IFM89_021440 [Coptis chinensis]|uniref:Pentatricopeptide repeat-containing protein n=1 Tax=Coptis chinensis TaxID=261450 RepID=A0A835MAF3_9MAGN|nr:hypothetical protein IFM89_021440 [Coptis chinensis]
MSRLLLLLYPLHCSQQQEVIHLHPALSQRQRRPQSPINNVRPSTLSQSPHTSKLRVESVIHGGDLDHAFSISRNAVESVVFTPRPILLKTCLFLLKSVHSTGVFSVYDYFFTESKTFQPELFSYEILIQTLCDVEDVDEAITVYHWIRDLSIPTSPTIYFHITKALISADRVSDTKELLADAHADCSTHCSDVMYNLLISYYLEVKNVVESTNQLFDELRSCAPIYERVVNATYVDYYLKRDMEKEAMKFYQEAMEYYKCAMKIYPKTWNVLLEVLLKYGKTVEANLLFDMMLN